MYNPLRCQTLYKILWKQAPGATDYTDKIEKNQDVFPEVGGERGCVHIWLSH